MMHRSRHSPMVTGWLDDGTQAYSRSPSRAGSPRAYAGEPPYAPRRPSSARAGFSPAPSSARPSRSLPRAPGHGSPARAPSSVYRPSGYGSQYSPPPGPSYRSQRYEVDLDEAGRPMGVTEQLGRGRPTSRGGGRRSATPVPREEEQYRQRTPDAHRRGSGVPRSPSRPSSSRRPSVASVRSIPPDGHPVFPGYEFVKSLRRGGMSESVSLVRRHGTCYVEKRMRSSGSSRLFRMETELLVLQKILSIEGGHPNLNQLRDHLWTDYSLELYMILKWCTKGSLHDNIKKHRDNDRPYAEEFLWHLMLSMANGLAWMHHGIEDAINGDRERASGWDVIAHLDLKPHNVFLTMEGVSNGEWPRVVIGDFGCCVMKSSFDSGEVSRNVRGFGTAAWDPPEASSRIDYKCDLFNMAAIVHAAATLSTEPNRRRLRGLDPCTDTYSVRLNDVVSRQLGPSGDRVKAPALVVECLAGMAWAHRRES